MKKIFTILFVLFLSGIIFATISWMGNSSVNPASPTADQSITFYVEMYDSYSGSHAEVVIDFGSDGSDWTTYNMPYKSENEANSTWETTMQLPEGTHTFYYHGWDDWGANVYDNNGGSNYSITVDAPLPVELTSFSTFTNGEDVTLNWQTASEVNNYGFNIERKKETGDWNKIEFINGHGNSNSPKSYSFIDNTITSGKYSYRLKQIDIDGTFEYSQTVEVDLGVPSNFELSQNYPNPFNPTTTISYAIPMIEASFISSVQLIVYDMLGEKVATLVNEEQASGNYNVHFDASKLSSGIYYYILKTKKYSDTKKMLLLK